MFFFRAYFALLRGTREDPEEGGREERREGYKSSGRNEGHEIAGECSRPRHKTDLRKIGNKIAQYSSRNTQSKKPPKPYYSRSFRHCSIRRYQNCIYQPIKLVISYAYKKKVIITGFFIQEKKSSSWCVRTAFPLPASDVGNRFKLRICTPPMGMPNQNLGINKVVSRPHFQPSSPPQRRHQYSPTAH